MTRGKLAALRERLAGMGAVVFRPILPGATLRDNLDGCIGCGCLSIRDCPLRNPWDELGDGGAGPRLLDPA